MKICPVCRGLFPDDFEKCSECGEILIDNSSYKKMGLNTKVNNGNKNAPKQTVTINRKSLPKNNNNSESVNIPIPKCPTCGSTNINKISGTKKAVGFLTIGVFSSNFGKTMECKNCGYKW